MNIQVYCDESGLEALANKSSHTFVAIGGIWMPSEFREEFKLSINELKNEFGIKGEFKWQKVSLSHIEFYKRVIDYFFNCKFLRFRVILIEASRVNNDVYNDKDNELGFYKFYYQLLHHWILSYNSYEIFTDLKVNRNKRRLKKLHEILSYSNVTAEILRVQGLPSNESIGIQLADVLTGIVNTKYNKQNTGTAKNEIITYIEHIHLKKGISATQKIEEKFNIFQITLKDGW
jgi:hypothetical protein